MDHTDPHESDGPAPVSEGFSDWSVVDDLLPDIIQAHHTACGHAVTGSVLLGALLPDNPHGMDRGAVHAVHIRMECAVCSLVTSVCCHVRTADALARPDAEDPDTVTDADVAALLVDCLATDVTLSPDLVRWTYRDGQVSPYWRGLIFKPAGMSEAEASAWVADLLSSPEPAPPRKHLGGVGNGGDGGDGGVRGKARSGADS